MKSYLKVGKVAELLRVQKSTIYQWTHIEFIPHFKVGNVMRFEAEMVLEWYSKVSNKGRKQSDSDAHKSTIKLLNVLDIDKNFK